MRFLGSRLLWHSGLCSLFTISCGSYRLHFYPTALSATLWLDPTERFGDEAHLKKLLRRDDVVIDVGANIGTLTLTAAEIVGTFGKVYSIEAHPRTHQYLIGNLRLNRFTNIETFNVACGANNGLIHFSDEVCDDQNRISANGITVPVQRLDELLPASEAAEIALLKIDVEGYEKFVLEGASGLLPRVKFIYFESYERHFAEFGYKLRDITNFLEAFGFNVYHLNGKRVSKDYDSAVCENLLARRSVV